ncbi:unnamed protein product [Leptosia nina]|uniref:Odorant receptor n=1 Tax=Leptosia nina TaxID=320188 RepID=A0AAV1IVQ0_9NEOP
MSRNKIAISAGECVEVHVRVLRAVGFLRCHAHGHTAYRLCVLAFTTLYLVQECVYAYVVRGDMNKLSRVMFLLLCHVTSLAKQIVFHLEADEVDALIGAIDDPAFKVESPQAARLVEACKTRAWRVEAAYAGCAVVTCILWFAFALLDRAHGHPVEFPFWSPVSTEPAYFFGPVLLYSYYVTTLVGIANTTADAFMATVLYLCQTQIKVLRMNLESLPERAWKVSQSTGKKFEATLDRLLVHSLHHYRHITCVAESLQNIFGGAILVQFGIGGWILCMAAYKIVSLSVLSIEFASMTLFIFCILTELFLYCYFGTELSVESSYIAESVYLMQWLFSGPRFRRSLVLVMERARRPLRPRAARLVPLSLETFLKILKSSYTFYAVLRQTK